MTLPSPNVPHLKTQPPQVRAHPASEHPSTYLWLICALPNRGCPGVPYGMFYEDTPEGKKSAEEFSKAQDRPG